MTNTSPSTASRARSVCSVLLVFAFAVGVPHVAAQQPTGNGLTPEERASAALNAAPEPDASSTETNENPSPDLLGLLSKGGWLMLPIAVISLFVVAFSVERALALRRSRVLPNELVEALGQVAESPTPKNIYKACQQYPSSAARVLRAVLLKTGRPQPELESAVFEACQREASELHDRVRTLNLAAAVSPLWGLLGTVWGMIQAFFATANLPDTANRAESLAEGIYVALVTTFAGLCVAIPAAMLAHYFEGRIERQMRDVTLLAESLLPHLSRFEGRVQPASDKPAHMTSTK